MRLMKLIHSSKYRLRTITMSFVLVLAAVSGVGVATSFVGTTPSAASPTTCPVGSTLQAALDSIDSVNGCSALEKGAAHRA